MKSKKSYYLLTFIISSVIAVTLVAVFSIYFIGNRERPIKIYKDEQIFEEIKVEFNNFNPGDEKKYTLKFKGVDDGKYSIDFDFVETEVGELKNYLDFVIKMNGEEVVDCPFIEVLSGERDINFELMISAREVVEFEICYRLPETVGNEAQNAEADFKFFILIKETEVVW